MAELFANEVQRGNPRVSPNDGRSRRIRISSESGAERSAQGASACADCLDGRAEAGGRRVSLVSFSYFVYQLRRIVLAGSKIPTLIDRSGQEGLTSESVCSP